MVKAYTAAVNAVAKDPKADLDIFSRTARGEELLHAVDTANNDRNRGLVQHGTIRVARTQATGPTNRGRLTISVDTCLDGRGVKFVDHDGKTVHALPNKPYPVLYTVGQWDDGWFVTATTEGRLKC